MGRGHRGAGHRGRRVEVESELSLVAVAVLCGEVAPGHLVGTREEPRLELHRQVGAVIVIHHRVADRHRLPIRSTDFDTVLSLPAEKLLPEPDVHPAWSYRHDRPVTRLGSKVAGVSLPEDGMEKGKAEAQCRGEAGPDPSLAKVSAPANGVTHHPRRPDEHGPSGG